MRLVLFVLTILKIVAAATVKIPTPSGEIEGSTDLVTRLGKIIYAFRGIRYATALRFQPPIPLGNWSGTYNATSDGPACPQLPIGSIPISEDCLFLNVYTTKLPDARRNPKRPVIIHFHGGGFWLGTAHSSVIGPQYILDEPIVFVAMNYRLGALGFTAVNKEVPGNNGLKDQVVAMKWVKKHIEAFGGDPNSITLYGFSAGACSISLHLVSKMSKGLFHRAILGSCSSFGPFPIPTEQISLAQKQARFVGCPDDTPEIILDCLRNKSVEEIANTLPQFNEFGHNPVAYWSPVIERDYGQERFLTEHPIKSVMFGRFEQVPVLAGVSRDEFATQAIEIVQNQTLLQELNDYFELNAPIIFNFERDSARSKHISRQIRRFYFGDQPIGVASVTKLGEAFADLVIGFSVNRAVEIISKRSLKPVYYYEFIYQEIKIPFGVAHGVDQVYILKPDTYPIPVPPDFPNATMVKIMVSFVCNFARTGNPNKPENVSDTKWLEYNTFTKRYLEIGEDLVMRDHLFQDRYGFLARLFPLSSYLH